MADEISTLMAKNKNKKVLLRLRNSKTITGILKDFDIHMNLTLEDTEEEFEGKTEKVGKTLLRGDNILLISLPKEES
ncbi:MAG: putative snRNP Sm-like protein [Nitrosopumilus sp.]|nr:putative snRNP Sm-like protein [Nitrosopumilus sp.]